MKGLLHFYQQSSSSMIHQANHRTNMTTCKSYKSNSRYELDDECICIGIIGQTRSVPLNVLSSVYISIHMLACLFPVLYSCEYKMLKHIAKYLSWLS